MNAENVTFLNNVVSLLPDCFSLEVRHYIACQFALESSFGESPLSKCNNNFCGMKVPSVRITLACNLDEKGNFAVFNGIYSCVCDYLLWLNYNKFSRAECNKLGLFVSHLSISGYCPEPDYISKINKLYSRYYGCKTETMPC